MRGKVDEQRCERMVGGLEPGELVVIRDLTKLGFDLSISLVRFREPGRRLAEVLGLSAAASERARYYCSDDARQRA